MWYSCRDPLVIYTVATRWASYTKHDHLSRTSIRFNRGSWSRLFKVLGNYPIVSRFVELVPPRIGVSVWRTVTLVRNGQLFLRERRKSRGRKFHLLNPFSPGCHLIDPTDVWNVLEPHRASRSFLAGEVFFPRWLQDTSAVPEVNVKGPLDFLARIKRGYGRGSD